MCMYIFSLRLMNSAQIFNIQTFLIFRSNILFWDNSTRSCIVLNLIFTIRPVIK